MPPENRNAEQAATGRLIYRCFWRFTNELQRSPKPIGFVCMYYHRKAEVAERHVLANLSRIADQGNVLAVRPGERIQIPTSRRRRSD